MITKETLDSVNEEAANADTSGLLIELDVAVLDQIGGGSTPEFRSRAWAV